MSRKHTGYGKEGLLSPTISKLGPRRAAAPLLHNSSQPVPDRASRAETKESSNGAAFPLLPIFSLARPSILFSQEQPILYSYSAI